MGDDRQEVARKQAALLAALRGNAETPPEFNATNVANARGALLRKRARGIEKSWPRLAAELAPNLLPILDAHTRATGNIQSGGPFAEGFALAHWLYENGKLPTAAAYEFLRASLYFNLTPQGLLRRRGLRVKIVKVATPEKYMFGVALGNYVRVFASERPVSRPRPVATSRYVE